MQPNEIQPSSRLSEDLGLAGDDGLELVEAYAEALDVDISEFRTLPHFGPEAGSPLVGMALGIAAFAGYAVPWTIPLSIAGIALGYRWLVRREVPSGPFTLTVADLATYAEAGTWGFDYERAEFERRRRAR